MQSPGQRAGEAPAPHLQSWKLLQENLLQQFRADDLPDLGSFISQLLGRRLATQDLVANRLTFCSQAYELDFEDGVVRLEKPF